MAQRLHFNLGMITNTKQAWTPGATVKVGFLTLRVVTSKAIKDGLPDIYLMENLRGDAFYEFIPHNGLNKLASIDGWR